MLAEIITSLDSIPDERCRPKIESEKITFSISLKDIYRCVVQKVEDKGTVSQERAARNIPSQRFPRFLLNLSCWGQFIHLVKPFLLE